MNDFDTLVNGYGSKEIKGQLSEKKCQDFSMEDYLDFAEKFPNKPKLAKDWVALALLFKEILKYEESKQSEVYIFETSDMEKELKEIQQKKEDKHIVDIAGEIYEIDISDGIPRKITEKDFSDYYLRKSGEIRTKDYPPSQQSLISNLPYEIIMNALNELELKVEELTNKFDNFITKNSIKRITKDRERIYVYSEQRDEALKILNYCEEHNIDVWPVAPGTFRIPSLKYVSELRNAGFNFKTTNTLKTIDDNKKFIESHKKQIAEHYNL